MAMSKAELLEVIKEVYNEKMTLDVSNANDNLRKQNFDLFTIDLFQKRYKLNCISDLNLEKVILAIQKLRCNDNRIDLFFKFLNLEKESSLRRDILENYLQVLKCNIS